MERESKWKTKKLAKTFLEGVRGAIPGADLQLAVIGKIADRWCVSPKRILDLGCGDGILGQFLLNRFSFAMVCYSIFQIRCSTLRART